MNGLFDDEHDGSDPALNLLPQDGVLNNHGRLGAAGEADVWLAALLQHTPWQKDQVQIGGQLRQTVRQVAWMADRPWPYTYSGVVHRAIPWTPDVLPIKARVEAQTGAVFNACLLNLYPDGQCGMGWHSDDEAELLAGAPIASLSLGAERRFDFRHKTEARLPVLRFVLRHGQLLVMRGETQQHWQHAIAKTAGVQTPRVNLTFRCMRTR